MTQIVRPYLCLGGEDRDAFEIAAFADRVNIPLSWMYAGICVDFPLPFDVNQK